MGFNAIIIQNCQLNVIHEQIYLLIYNLIVITLI